MAEIPPIDVANEVLQGIGAVQTYVRRLRIYRGRWRRNPKGNIANLRDEMWQYVSKDLIPKIDQIVIDTRYHQPVLSERFVGGCAPDVRVSNPRAVALHSHSHARISMATRRDVVDRPLDIAVSQFAPGSQTVKDKQVFTAAGAADFIPAEDTVRVQPGFVPQLFNDYIMPYHG